MLNGQDFPDPGLLQVGGVSYAFGTASGPGSIPKTSNNAFKLFWWQKKVGVELKKVDFTYGTAQLHAQIMAHILANGACSDDPTTKF